MISASVTNSINISAVLSKGPRDSVTVNQYAQYRIPETKAAKLKSAIIILIISICGGCLSELQKKEK